MLNSELYLARKTLIEMLTDREYGIEEKGDINMMPVSIFKTLEQYFNNDSGILDIYSTYLGENSRLLDSKTIIKFVYSINNNKQNFIKKPIQGSSKAAINEIKRLISVANIQYDLKKKDNIVFIICYGDKLHEDHIELDNNNENIQIFHINNLIFNISKHNLVPKHILIDEIQEKMIVDKFKLNSLDQLPHIKYSDPMAKYINLKSGNVCKIIRASKNAGEHICYRYCENDDSEFFFE